MTVDELRSFYNAKTDSELARTIKKGRSTISGWRENGIPERTQAYFQAVSKGALTATIESTPHIQILTASKAENHVQVVAS